MIFDDFGAVFRFHRVYGMLSWTIDSLQRFVELLPQFCVSLVSAKRCISSAFWVHHLFSITLHTALKIDVICSMFAKGVSFL